MMDHLIIEAVEAAFSVGLPTDAGAVLLVELDGSLAELDDEVLAVAAVCRTHGAREVRAARDEAERAALWKCRKRAFGAVGRLAPNYCTQDGVVPRTKVPDILRAISAIGERHHLRIANVFHAGDGNIHPILLYDERDADEVRRVIAAGHEILRACVDLGGSITGEHGIGVERSGDAAALLAGGPLAMQALRAAFDPDLRSISKITRPGFYVRTRPRRQVPL
jgi:glycolate oxidase